MQDDVNDDYRLIGRLRAMQTLQRDWRPLLSMAERDLLAYLIDNTMNWGHNRLKVTVQQMIDGTEWGLPSVSIPRRTLFRALTSLRKRGLVRTTLLKGRVTLFALNFNWTPNMLPIPKRKRDKSPAVSAGKRTDFDEPLDTTSVEQAKKISGVPNWHSTCANMAQDVCQIGTPYKSNREGYSDNHRRAARSGSGEAEISPGNSVAQAVESVRSKSTKRRAQRRKDGSASPFEIWYDAWRATYATAQCPMWSRKDTAIMDKLEIRATATGINWVDFLNLAVCHWNRVTVTKMAWMTRNRPPLLPDVRFFSAFFDMFVEWYLERDMQEINSLNPTEEEEIAKLVASGMDYDAVRKEITRRRDQATGRDASDDKLRDAQRYYAAAEKMLREARLAATPRSATPQPEVRVTHGDNPYEQDDPPVIPTVATTGWQE